MTKHSIALSLFLALAMSALSSGCSGKSQDRPRPELSKGGLRDVTPKSAVAPKLQSPP